MKRQLLTLVFLTATVLAPSAVFSQERLASTPDEESESSGPPSFEAPAIDILVHGGFGGFLYPHVEPGVDVGIVPLGKGLTLSVGGGIDFGWCALCSLIDLVSDLDIDSSYYSPQGRVNLHLGTLGDLIPRKIDNFTIDVYAGIFAGPVFYTFRVEPPEGGAFTADQVGFIVGPALGIRLGFANNRILLLGEYRWSREAGFTTVTVEDDQGNNQTITAEDFSRGGNDFLVGIGFRI